MKKLMLSVLGAAAARRWGVRWGESRTREVPGPARTSPQEVQGQRFSAAAQGGGQPGLRVGAGAGAAHSPSPRWRARRCPCASSRASRSNLTQTQQAHLLGLFVVPEGVDRVKVEVSSTTSAATRRPRAGGHRHAGGAAALRIAGGVPRRARARAVVHLDLETSLRARARAGCCCRAWTCATDGGAALRASSLSPIIRFPPARSATNETRWRRQVCQEKCGQRPEHEEHHGQCRGPLSRWRAQA